jgi:hypothetical protein
VFLDESFQNSEEPQVAIAGNGVGLASWERFDGSNFRIQIRSRSATGVLGSVQTLSAPGADAFSSQVALNATGTGIIAWTRTDAAGNDRIQAVTRSSTGVLGTVQTLSDPLQNAESPQVAIDSNGNAIVVWERSDGTNTRIQEVQISSAGVPGSVQTLSDGGADAFSPQVAVGGNGNALVVWSRFQSACPCDKIQDRTVSAAGVLGSSIQGLSPSPYGNESPQVGIDANGNGVVVWESFKGSQENVLGRTRSAAGGLGSIQKLSTSGLAFSPQVAMNGVGNALAVWTRTGSFDRIQASAGP